MKKIILFFVLVACYAAINAQIVTSENAMVKFSSISEFTALSETQITRDNVKTQTATLSGVSVLPSINSNIYELPDFLLSILNTDNMVTIGVYMVKFDFANERLLIANKATTNALAALQANNAAQEGVMSLPFENSVDGIEFIEGLEAGTITESNYNNFLNDGSTARCNTIKGKEKKDKLRSTLKMRENQFNQCLVLGENGCNGDMIDYTYDYKIVYQNFGLYLRLRGNALAQMTCKDANPIIPTLTKKDLYMAGKISYTLRCRDSYGSDAYDERYDNELQWTPYEGWRKVTALNWRVNCKQKHTWDATYNHDIPLELIRKL